MNIEEGIILLLLQRGEEDCKRDIIIRTRGGELHRISELNKYYDALQYPLAFPKGEPSYSIDIPLITPTTVRQNLSLREYYTNQLMIRDQVFNIFHHCRDLFQQILVDWYSKIESNKLSYLYHNQNKIRLDLLIKENFMRQEKII